MEDYFIMVWWEQHGSGISHSRDIPSETMNQEQMISDIKEVTEYLLRRFHKLKIYLMGHSGIMQNFSKIMLHFFLPNVVIFDVSLINNKMKSQTDLMPVRIVKTA